MIISDSTNDDVHYDEGDDSTENDLVQSASAHVNQTDKRYGVSTTFRSEAWVIPIITISFPTIVLLISCAVISFLYITQPSTAIGTVIRLGPGLPHIVAYSCVLVKIFFITAVQHEVVFPLLYQIILLFISVLTHLVILLHWIATVPTYISMSCGLSFQQSLHGKVYNMFLLGLLAILCMKYTYYETIRLGVLVNVIMWTVWVVGGLYILHSNYQ